MRHDSGARVARAVVVAAAAVGVGVEAGVDAMDIVGCDCPPHAVGMTCVGRTCLGIGP